MTDPNEAMASFEIRDGIVRVNCTLSKREFFSAMAMAGMMSMSPKELLEYADPKFGTVAAWMAENCTAMADVLIARLNQGAKP